MRGAELMTGAEAVEELRRQWRATVDPDERALIELDARAVGLLAGLLS